MPLISRQKGPIAVYGATGYTGRLVVAELSRAEADFVVSGRNPEKLESLRAELGLEAPARAASLDDPASLRELLSDCSAVIDCAGPFVSFGEPVLAAAVVPAMGFDYVPGDMIAALTAEGMGELDELSLHYCWRDFIPSQGTARTTLEIITGGDVEWNNMEWRKPSGGYGRGTYEFPAPVGRRRMIRYPAGEQITVPRHVPTRNVRTTINAGAFSSDLLARVYGAILTPAALAMRIKPLRRSAGALISRLPEGPTPEQREKMRWTIVCEATSGEVARKGVVSGKDVYGLTAAAVVRGALIAAGRGFEASGGLAPSQAFQPKSFLGDLERFDLDWQVFETHVPVPIEA